MAQNQENQNGTDFKSLSIRYSIYASNAICLLVEAGYGKQELIDELGILSEDVDAFLNEFFSDDCNEEEDD